MLEIHLTRKGHALEFPLDRLVAATAGLSGRQLSYLAAAAAERMVVDRNVELPDLVARGTADLAGYRLKTRPLRWYDFEPVLATTEPDTTPESLQRFDKW